jgi:hypothetical protein
VKFEPESFPYLRGSSSTGNEKLRIVPIYEGKQLTGNEKPRIVPIFKGKQLHREQFSTTIIIKLPNPI